MSTCQHAYTLRCLHRCMLTCLHAQMPRCLHAHMHACLSGPPCTALGLSGHLWTSLGYSGPFWAILGLSGLPWAILWHSGPFRAILGHSGPFWAILGYAWQFWAILGLHAYMLTCLHAYMPTCLHAYMLWSAAPLLAYNIASVRPPAAHPILAGLVFQAYSCLKCHHMRSTVSADTSYLMSCPDHGITCFTMGNLTVLDGHQLTIAPNL